MTNVPTKWYKLYHQRIRWSRSLVRFRLRKHADILLPTKNWSILNWLSNMESVVYDCFLNFLWLWYIIKLAITYNTHIIEVLALGYFIRVCFSQLAFLLVLMVSERKKDVWFLYRYLPLMSLIQVISCVSPVCRLICKNSSSAVLTRTHGTLRRLRAMLSSKESKRPELLAVTYIQQGAPNKRNNIIKHKQNIVYDKQVF